MPRRLEIAEEIKRAIIDRYQSKVSFSQLEKEFGISSPALRKYIKAWGVFESRQRDGSRSPSQIRLTESSRQLLIEAYTRGDSIPVIARLLKVRNTVISAWVRQEGLFVKRRNKEYKHKITDQQIVDTFSQTRSIRLTSRKLAHIDPRYVKKILVKMGVKDITAKEIYLRLEPLKTDIIKMYQERAFMLPQICERFNISKQILRQVLKKWGVYDVRSRPRLTLIKSGAKPHEIISFYDTTKSLQDTSQKFGISVLMVSRVLKQHGVKNYNREKSVILEANKETIISDYTSGARSVKEIASHFDVWATSINDLLNRCGIKIENRHIKRTQDIVTKNKERIYDLYLNQSYCLREIAALLDVSHNTIIRAVKRWGIAVPDNRFKESSLERSFKKMLTHLGIKFSQYLKVANRIYDFYLPDFNLIVECNGDYWHGNPNKFTHLSEEQTRGQERDKVKTELAHKHGYSLYFIWETEVNDTPDKVVTLLQNLIGGKAILQQKSPVDFLTHRLVLAEQKPLAP